MRIHYINRKSGLVSVAPESVEDLWTLRRIIAKGDTITGETKRVVKDRGEFTRPDKGERIRVRLTIEVESVRLDSVIERLRITGRILETSDESVTKGEHHSFIVSLGHSIGIRKERLEKIHIDLLKKSSSPVDRMIIVAVDRREAGVGSIAGTHLEILPSIYSGLAGKMYSNPKASMEAYFSRIQGVLRMIHREGVKVAIAGPGEVKRALANFIIERDEEIGRAVSVIDGIDLTGEDGVYTSLRSPSLARIMEETTLAKAEELLGEATRRIAKDDGRVVFSLRETIHAGRLGSIEALLVSNRIFDRAEEDQVVELLNSVEKFRGRTILVDDSTDAGRQVDSLGGALALLRHPVART